MKALQATPKASLIISDHNEVFLAGLRNIVRSVSNVRYVCSASTIDEIQILLSNHFFQTICLDLDFHDINMRDYIQQLRYKFSSMNILMLSNYFDKKLVSHLFQIGAKGFLLKTTGKLELINALNKVNDGSQYIDGNVADVFSQTEKNHANNHLIISRKCKEILFLLSHELTIQQIANHMGLSNKTIEKHRSELFKVIGVKNMVGLAMYAYRSHIHADINLQQKYSSIIF